MKKNLFVGLSFLALNAVSQSSLLITKIATSSTLAANASITATTTLGSTTSFDFDIKNTGSTTKSYNVKRYDVILNNGADAYFCFAGSCYGSNVSLSLNPLTLNAGQSASQIVGANNIITADLDESVSVGYSYVKYTVINTSNTADSLQFGIKYNVATNISELVNASFSSFEIFPNPATETAVLKVNSQKAIVTKLTIYNALGAMVTEQPIGFKEGENKVDLNFNYLQSGIYFVQLKMSHQSITKRLIIN